MRTRFAFPWLDYDVPTADEVEWREQILSAFRELVLLYEAPKLEKSSGIPAFVKGLAAAETRRDKARVAIELAYAEAASIGILEELVASLNLPGVDSAMIRQRAARMLEATNRPPAKWAKVPLPYDFDAMVNRIAARTTARAATRGLIEKAAAEVTMSHLAKIPSALSSDRSLVKSNVRLLLGGAAKGAVAIQSLRQMEREARPFALHVGLDLLLAASSPMPREVREQIHEAVGAIAVAPVADSSGKFSAFFSRIKFSDRRARRLMKRTP